MLCLPLCLAACLAWEDGAVDGLRLRTTSTTVPISQALGPRVEIMPGETSFLFTAVLPTEARGYVAQLIDPQGAVAFEASDWWESERNKTNGGFSSAVLNINWPISEDDGPLQPGVWTVETRSADVGTTYDATIAIKSDDDLTSGALAIDLVVLASISDDDDAMRGIQAALAMWKDEVYGPAGIDIDISTRVWSGAAELASPGYGDPEVYAAITADKPLRAVTVLVIDGVNDGANIFGVAGGIPGPLVPSDRSVVVVSALEARGSDGVFSASEERQFAETMAHEVGHYLGLYHPAELPVTGDRIDSWDAVDDTPECADYTACVRDLGSNLMFPTPLCAQVDGFQCASFVEQDVISAGQAGILHRYVGMD